MLFKLSLKNMKKSMKDYAIYFMTLILGVAIFYVFNSLDSQEAMMQVNKSSREIIKLMLNMLAGISVFISIVLGFLIIYANNFLIKRRKKEFGMYMTLGMGKRQISRILVIETLLIGIISLGVGLAIGVFASQLMSILVAKMFEADMSQYQFAFSQAAMIKTVIYFGIMYVLVMLFNTFSISKYKLIDLLTAIKKNEKVKIKNPIICIIVFLISIFMLAYAYRHVMILEEINNIKNLYKLIIMGAVATFLFFWSLSGFILRVVQSCKNVYYKGLNCFVLRQINSKVNTTVFSMTIICLMLFVTIGVLSSALSLNDSIKRDLQELTPVDLTISKVMDPSDTKNKKLTSSVVDILKEAGFDVEKELKQDYIETSSYIIENITLKSMLGNSFEETSAYFKFLHSDTLERLMKVSDYNKIARLYGTEQLSLNENEYLVVCDYDNMKEIRDKGLQQNIALTIEGKQYLPKVKKCIEGFIEISPQHTNDGIIILPDEALEKATVKWSYLNANYNADTEEGKDAIEEKLQNISIKGVSYNAVSKIAIYEASRGLGAMVVFIGLYLGVIFLISSAAILALKELSESSDNKERYRILRKIGADEKMIHKALFTQIAIFFLLPLALACVHSIFGLQFANLILETMGRQDMLASIGYTTAFILLIYGGYFIATYLGSKNIIKENR